MQGCCTGLGANKMEKAISRVGKCIQTVSDVIDQCDKKTSCNKDSGRHTCRSEMKDFKQMLRRIREGRVFQFQPGGKHNAFQYLSNSLASCVGTETLKERIVEHLPTSLHSRIVHNPTSR